MSKLEWGIKRVCPSCGIKYYDFNKNPIICPKCEFQFDPDLLLKSRKGRSISAKTEDNIVSSDFKKEQKTLEEDVNSIEGNDDILEIDDVSDIHDEDINNDIDKKIEDVDNDIDIIDDDLEDKDNFSIEVNDEDLESNKDKT